MSVEPGQLSIVSTPIGNLGDLSPRAADILEKADIIACEDTRITRKLLSLTGRRTYAKLIPYHDHNGHTIRPRLIEAIANGSSVALVSDSGTPLVSDPGYKLVVAAHEHGFKVTAIPGPSALLAGLTCAGLPSDQFLFAGFVPNNSKNARKAFLQFAGLPITTIWFESPKRLANSLAIMVDVFGPRLAVVARELTKLHEEFNRATLAELANIFALRPPPRGEVVVLVEGSSQSEPILDDAMIKSMLREEMRNKSLRDAVKAVTEISGEQRRRIYKLAIEIVQ